MPAPPNKDQVTALVEHFAKVSRQHVRERRAAGEHFDAIIDEVVAGIAIFAAMSVSKVPTDKVRRLDDFNASFRAQLAAEIVASFKPFEL